jgi:hypothetical protein
VATPRSGPSDGLDEFIAGAEDSGAKVTRDTVAGHDAARIDAADGSKFVAAVKGCHIVLVIAPNERIVQQIASAVFTT